MSGKNIPKGKVIVKEPVVRNLALTAKQDEFAMSIASGTTLIDAYRGAYDCEDMKPSTCYQEASRLMDNPRVAARVREIMDDRISKSMIRNSAYVRQHIFDRLMIESSEPKNAGAVRVKALELLGKIDVVAMFKETTEAPRGDRRPDEVEAELKAKLRRFIDASDQAIDPGTQATD